ncbi:MAG: xanthine dehydrogenase molybdopterin binding subunit [Pseudomonadota bacterium]
MDDIFAPLQGRGEDDTPARASHAPIEHDSGAKHVAGTAIYADDIPEPTALLHVEIGIAGFARGTARVDLRPVKASPGVVAVLTGDDVPGLNDIGSARPDEPLLNLVGGAAEVHYEGQPLFAVAATSRRAARVAAAQAVVDASPEPPIVTVADAIAAGSHLEETARMARGDVDAAIEAAPRRLTGQIEIGGQEHFALESQVAVATPGEDDEMHIVSSHQHPSECQEVVARVLGVPSHAVTVEVRRLGGGFGGKESQGNLPAAIAALVARQTGRPAKVRLDRDRDFIITGKRHDFVITYEVGFDDTGRLHGVRFVQNARCGWSLDLTRGVCDRAMSHADNAYSVPAMEVISHRWRTNTPSNTAFRGFGGPQGMMGMERVIEHVAHETGRDPLEVRRINLYRASAPAEARTTHYHMVVDDLVIEDIVEELGDSADYGARRKAIAAWNETSPIIKRGLSLVPVKFGISFTLTQLNQAGALVHVYKDGSVMINHGGIEMGQGVYIKCAQAAADAFGIGIGHVKITATRTDKVPNTGPTAASAGADLNAMAILDACATIKARLVAFLAAREGVAHSEVRFLDGNIFAGDTAFDFADVAMAAWQKRVSLSSSGFYATPDLSWDRVAGRGRPFYYFAYGAAVTEAALDTLTGESRIVRTDILHDCGRSLNPAVDLGQIEGGYVQGVGWLVTEELVFGEDGRLKTHAPATYKIPCASDRAPDMRVKIWPRGENRKQNVRRSKAVGEPPLLLAVSAHQAIGDAIMAARPGFHGLDAPATPERVLMALARGQ